MLYFCKYELIDEVVYDSPGIVRKGEKKVRYHDNDRDVLLELVQILGGEENVAYCKIKETRFANDDNFLIVKYIAIMEEDFQQASQYRNRLLYSDDDDY